MNINRVTITGADDAVKIFDLMRITRRFPFVEWGILFGANEEVPRFPSWGWVEALTKQLDKNNLAAHLCGKHSRFLLEKHKWETLLRYDQFGRLQINYNFKKAAEETFAEFVGHMSSMRRHDLGVIFQINDNNRWTVISMPQQDWMHNLYDASGGRGKKIAKLAPPFKCYTGYAGGIGPDNIGEICNIILTMPYGVGVWIDMESAVRDENNCLDLDKVEFVLETVRDFFFRG